MTDFAPMNDLKDLRSRRETLRFALRNESFCFCWFSALSWAQNAFAREIDGGLPDSRADVGATRRAVLCGGPSKMAPQAIGIAQNRIQKWRAGSQSPGASVDQANSASGRQAVLPRQFGQ
jgi:hypothetical protein